ncbi:CHAT domain protein [Planctomycetes bacterium Poly30]|uniref:CHAT domain protein n=1 Tax=Saltatorellus ferox TaxID=2528018 RepID=A0A518EY56_9BACT|nr:CHAT domain protein [Planctomycetes bacterium Poly30]
MRRGSQCALALIFSALLHATHASGHGTPLSDPPSTTTAERDGAADLTVAATRFIESLDAYRRGDLSARTALLAAAEELRRRHQRADPAEIAAFYQGLNAAALARGIALEDELDLLREEAAELSTDDLERLPIVRQKLEGFLLRCEGLEDVPVHAHALTLDARLGVRPLEQGRGPEGPAFRAELRALEEKAARSLELFRRAGQVTPTLEPLWILARCALLRADLDTAEDRFMEMDVVAERVHQLAWRERGLLGLIGLARERGSLFIAEDLLDQLATFRAPESCWALAREVAAQKLFVDDGESALSWLARFPPSELDEELAAGAGSERAWEEWRNLVSAAEMRSGRFDRARERMELADAAARGSTGESQGTIADLTRATIHLETNEPEQALALVRALRWEETSAVSRAERLTLEGRALLALGRCDEAILPLEEALAAARSDAEAPPDGHRANGSRHATVTSGSRVGEWLGLSAVETLGRAYVEAGSPLRAAGLFESAHAPIQRRGDCEAAILDLAGKTDLGYVTWMVGADQTLAVHVAPDGRASAASIPIGRRGLERGIERLRDALTATSNSASDPAWRALAVEMGEALLPAELKSRLASRAGSSATLVLAPHGVLERMPLEALLVGHDPRPLGVSTALTVMTALRNGEDLAPPLDGQRAQWMALGAPTTRDHALLPGARREIERIGALHPRWRAVTGDALTRSALEAALRGSSPLHLATHVAAVPRDTGRVSVAPWAFVVSSDELVSAHDVLQLRPRLPLVTLTACGSADGVSIDGLSVRGLAQTMLECGTRAAIVTLWPIQDHAAERASVRLHAALLGGASPAEATRRAREFLWQLGAAPSEWAAYRALE